MKTLQKATCLALLVAGLAGCDQAQTQFRQIRNTSQGTYESLANYKARLPILELKLPLEIQASPVLQRDWLRWVAYDSEAETLQITLPRNHLYIAKKFMLVVNEVTYFRDYGRDGKAAVTGVVPLASDKNTATAIAGMFWVVRYRPFLTRDRPITHERAGRDGDFGQYDEYTYPVELLAIELHDKAGKLWSAPLSQEVATQSPFSHNATKGSPQ